MKISITGRHFDVTEDLVQYAEKKLSKLEKYFHKLIDIEVIMFMERHNHIIEVVINGDGTKFYGTEKAGDMYSSVDLIVKSLEKQTAKHKEKHSEHKVQSLAKNFQMDFSEDRLDVQFYQAGNKPKDEVEAFLEMKTEEKDFILFKKHEKSSDNKDLNSFAVIYKTENGFRMAEIPSKMLKEKRFDAEKLLEFELIIQNESITKPKIKFKKCKDKKIRSMAVNNALKEITTGEKSFLPFFNNETNFLNILYKNGSSLEIMVPPL